MSDHYSAWNQDLMYSSEIPSESAPVNIENSSSPVRAQRFKASTLENGSPLTLTPSMSRSPLQTLIETPEGYLYSPCHPRLPDNSQV